MPAKKSKATASSDAAESTISAQLWAFVGTDDLTVKERAAAQCKALAVGLDEMSVEILEGSADNTDHAIRIVGQALEALQTLPFFGGEKVVWLRGVNFLADTITGRSAGTVDACERLMHTMKSLPSDVKFILSASEVDKRRTFFLSLKKIAHLETHDLIDTSRAGWEEQVMPLVEERARDFNLSFDDESLHLFTVLAGEATRQIDNELAKLSLYLGDETRVRADDVRAIVSHSRNGVVFELGNALGHQQLSRALRLVDELLEQGESAIGILLGAVVPKVRSMLSGKDIEARYGISPNLRYNDYTAALMRLPERDRERFPKKKDGSGLNVYPLYLAAKEAARFSMPQLRLALEECLKANLRLVTTSLDHTIVLNQLLIRILAY
jgi:DNA polymerase III subunit delta